MIDIVICPDCGSPRVQGPDDGGTYDCLNCGIYFELFAPGVEHDQERILAGAPPDSQFYPVKRASDAPPRAFDCEGHDWEPTDTSGHELECVKCGALWRPAFYHVQN